MMSTWQFTTYAWLYVIATAVSFWLAFLVRKQQPVSGSNLFIFLALFTGIWSLGYLLGFFNANPSWKLIMLRIEYLGIIGTAVIWLFFTAAYTQTSSWLSRWAIQLLVIFPIISFIQVLTINLHSFFYSSYDFIEHNGLIVFNKTYGPGFYLWVIYAYLLIIAGIAILIRGLRHMPGKLRWQVYPLMLVIISILSPNLIYVCGTNPFHPYDPTPLAFFIAGLTLFISMRFSRFLDITPVAHYLVFKNVNIGVIVIDHLARILEMNPAAEKIFACNREKHFGEPISQLFPQHLEKLGFLPSTEKSKFEINLDDNRCFELQVTPFQSGVGSVDNSIVMIYDISDRKLAEEELRRQATTDALTGVINRRHFFDLAESIFKQTRRYQRDLAALMIDLDHFKKINDQHLHRIGDQVLIGIADLIQSQIRSPDILGRYGGEEFVILMPETNLENAQNAAERLREAVDSHPVDTDIGPVAITISIGVATFERIHDVSIDLLINRADQALYAAKQAGRNTVICAPSYFDMTPNTK